MLITGAVRDGPPDGDRGPHRAGPLCACGPVHRNLHSAVRTYLEWDSVIFNRYQSIE